MNNNPFNPFDTFQNNNYQQNSQSYQQNNQYNNDMNQQFFQNSQQQISNQQYNNYGQQNNYQMNQGQQNMNQMNQNQFDFIPMNLNTFDNSYQNNYNQQNQQNNYNQQFYQQNNMNQNQNYNIQQNQYQQSQNQFQQNQNQQNQNHQQNYQQNQMVVNNNFYSQNIMNQSFNPIYSPDNSFWNFNPTKVDEIFPIQLMNYDSLQIQQTNFLDLAQNQQNIVQSKTKLLRDSIQKYLSSLPFIQDIINQVTKFLIPEQLYLPLKNLYDVIGAIPMDKLQSFGSKAKETVKKFAEAVEKGDFMPKSKFEVVKKITDAFLENETIKKNLLKFGGNFEVIGTAISDLLPLEFFEKFGLVIKNFSTIYVENFRKNVHEIPTLFSHGESVIKVVIQLLNPIDIFTVYFDILDKNKDGKISVEELIDIESHLEFFRKQKVDKSQLFEKLKYESTQLIQLLSNMNIVDNMIQAMYKIDFNLLYQILIMIKNSILNFNRKKFKNYISKLKELYQFMKQHKEMLLKILNPNHTDLAGVILNIFYEEPEFVKQATELFKEIFNTIDVEKVVNSFEQIITYFESVDLFKNIERFDFIGMACEKLKSTLSSCHEIYQKIKGMISIAVQRVMDLLKMGKDELGKIVGNDKVDKIVQDISNFAMKIFK